MNEKLENAINFVIERDVGSSIVSDFQVMADPSNLNFNIQTAIKPFF